MLDDKTLQDIEARMAARANGYRGGGALMSSTGWDACFDDFQNLVSYVRQLSERLQQLERKLEAVSSKRPSTD